MPHSYLFFVVYSLRSCCFLVPFFSRYSTWRDRLRARQLTFAAEGGEQTDGVRAANAVRYRSRKYLVEQTSQGTNVPQ